MAGCMGGQTGGEILDEEPTVPPVRDDASGDYAGCKERPTPIALADSSRLGFSGADVLEATLGTHRATLRWNANTGVIGFGPEHGDSSIDVTIQYVNGEVRFVEPTPMAGAGGFVEPAVHCRPNHLAVDVLVRIETAGGALAEEFTAALIATTPSHVELTRRIPVSDLQGAFYVTAPPGHVVGPLDIKVYFDANRVSGTLSGSAEQQVGRDPQGSVGITFVPFATWP